MLSGDFVTRVLLNHLINILISNQDMYYFLSQVLSHEPNQKKNAKMLHCQSGTAKLKLNNQVALSSTWTVWEKGFPLLTASCTSLLGTCLAARLP